MQAMFQNCTNLQTLNLTNFDMTKVTNITDMFTGSNALTTVISMAKTPSTLKEGVFSTLPTKETCSLSVPYASISRYQEADGWNELVNITGPIITIADGITYAEAEDFMCSKITYTRTFSKANCWNALYVPFAINVADYIGEFDIAEIYSLCPTSDTNNDGIIDTNDDAKMVVNILKTGTTVANRPYLIRPKEATTYNIEASNTLLHKAEINTVSCSTTHHEYVVKGLYTELPTSANDGNYYMSAYGNLSYRTSGTGKIKPNRWVMNIHSKDDYSEAMTTQSKFLVYVIGEDIDEATAIRYINGDFGTSSESDAIYNINGVKMNNTDNLPRGIYIKNGKKFIVK